jgi:YesN/AraC family two-component response regulator
MYKLLISDRDRQELSGIEWLISKYSFPVSTIMLADQVAVLIDELENEQPDILCFELDMIQEDKWEMVKSFINQHAGQVIAITAEATFERAMQAMSVKAVDLWVKPLGPAQVKHALQQTVRQLSRTANESSVAELSHGNRYGALFVDDGHPYPYPVYLLETEYVKDLDYLGKFIEQFDFYYEPVILPTSDRIVLVFDRSFPHPMKQAQRFLREWGNMAGGPMAIVVYEQGDESLHHTYMKLLKVMETTFFTGYKQVLNMNDMQHWKNMDPFLSMEEQRSWVSMLDDGNADAIKKWLYADFFDIASPYPEPAMLRTRLTSILAQVRRFMNRKGLTHSEDGYKQVFQRILHEPVLYRIVQDIILFLNDLFQLMNEQSTRIDITEAAFAYMENHYHHATLSLTEVAAHVGRSPSYFSHLLSKKHKQSFSSVLHNIRIEKAKALLETTDDSIQRIAESVGFRNANYFSRVFKSSTGITPRNWRT